MPRKSKEINPFDGGINNYANPRDIEDNESASLYNLSTLKKGELAPLKNWKITELTGTSNYLNTKLCTVKNGLFVYQRDFTTASTPVDGNTTVYLVATNIDGDKSKLFLVNSLTQSAVATEVFEFGNASGTVTILPCYVNADGNIRIGDGSFTTRTHFYGALKKYNLGGSVANYNINETNMISKPAGGNLYVGTMDESTSTTAGTLNLNINAVKSYSTVFFNYNSSSSELYPADISARAAYPNGITIGTGGALYQYGVSSADTTVQQYGYSNDRVKRNSNNTFSSTHLYAPGETSAGAKFLAVSSRQGNIPSDEWGAMSLEDKGKSLLSSTVWIHSFTEANGGRVNGFNFTDKSIFFDIWINTDTYNALASSALEVEIGTDKNNYFTFGFPSSTFTSAETWTTIEVPYGSHYNETGNTLNENSCKVIGIELVHPNCEWDTGDGELWGFNFAISQIRIGSPNEGQWVGKYNFYYNWVFENSQNSETFKFGNQSSPLETKSDILELMPYVKDGSSSGSYLRKFGGSTASSARITGANVFFSEVDDSGVDVDKDKSHLMELDFDRGARTSLFDEFTEFASTVTAGTKLTSILSVKSPSVIDTFSTITSFSEGDKLESINFSTGVMLNRRMYVGNVQIYDQSSQAFKYSDRIYKSLPNQPDVFTKNGYVEVAPNDGESITAIATYGDFLLEFKENNMYLINVTQDVEYLEEKYPFAGVKTEGGVCSTKNGVVWVNRYGLFLFDGKEVQNLLTEKIDRDYWYAQTATTPLIAYNPLEDQVHILIEASVQFIAYNFTTKGFERYTGLRVTDSADDAIGEDIWTNIITEPDGKLSALFNTGSETNLIRLESVPTGNSDYVYVEMITKDDPLGDPAQFKSLKKCYLTYKINNAQVPAITYRTNGSATDNAFDVAITNTSGVYTTLELKPNVRAEATNKHSYVVVIKGRSHASLVINDVNLVYREKSLK